MIHEERSFFFTAASWLLVVGWAGLIWKLLTLPGEQIPDITFVPFADKFAHLGLYFIWSLLICLAADRSLRWLSRVGVGAVAVVAAALYGVASEIYQAGIGRDADLLDILADTAGGFVAQYLYFSLTVRRLLTKLVPGRLSGKESGRPQVLPSLANTNPSDTTGPGNKGQETSDA